VFVVRRVARRAQWKCRRGLAVNTPPPTPGGVSGRL